MATLRSVTRRFVVVVTLLACLGAACSSTSRVGDAGVARSEGLDASSGPTAAVTSGTTVAPGVFRADPSCTFLLPEDREWFGNEVTCGWLVRPALDPDAKPFELPVAMFSAAGAAPNDDPIVFLHGGPGAGIVGEAGVRYATDIEPFLFERDVILFDQRGSGLALPALDCRQPYSLLRDFPELDADVVTDATVSAMRRCVERAEDGDVDLRSITLEESAIDVAVLARELGHDEINVVGVSWGGLLANHVTARFPDLVRSAVLDSPLSPQTDLIASMPSSFAEGLAALDAACAADPICASGGDLTDRFEAMVSALDAQPAVVELVPWGPRNIDDRDPVEIDGEEFADLVFGLLYSSTQARHLPDLLTDLENGDTRLLSRRIAADNWGWFWDFRFAIAMCNDMVGRSSQASADALATGIAAYDRVDDQPDGRGHTALRLCDESGLGTSRSADLAPHQVPTLILAGPFDPITPRSASQALAASLPRGRLLTLDGEGHGVRGTFCADEAVRAFLTTPDIASAPWCTSQPSSEGFPDHPLSDRGSSPVDEFVDAQAFGLDLTVRLQVPSTWARDYNALGNSWFRSDGAIDLTGISVLVDDFDGTARSQREQWTQYYFAEAIGPTTNERIGSTDWERELRLSANGIAIVSYDAPAVGVSVVLLAYPEEVEALDRNVMATVLASMSYEAAS